MDRLLPAALSCLLLSPAAGADEGLKKVSYIPQWSPQAQFAGYYVAADKGFYAKRGLDVDVLTGTPDVTPGEALKAGKADFATLWLAEGIRLRAGGLRLVNVLQTGQYTGLVLVARKAAGIEKPEDLQGRKVGLWRNFRSQPSAFFREYRLKVREVEQGLSVDLFLRGGVDAASAMSYNELHTILSSGLDPEELTVFRLDEHGFNFPEDGVYMREEAYRKDPQAARAFAQATVEGWVYAFAHPEEAVKSVLLRRRAAGLPADAAHQRWMLDRMRDLVVDRTTHEITGLLKPEDYERVAKALGRDGILRSAPGYKDFFIPCAKP
jgi:NitT/TauT family transport system substrate-binding protein